MVNFNNYNNTKESNMHRGFQKEIGEQRGFEGYYLKKTNENLDKVFGEDDNVQYKHAEKMWFIIENAEAYSAGGDTFGSWGFTINDQLELYIEQHTFTEATGLTHPIEHDLIYIELFNGWFDITFANHDTQFYINGQLHVFLIKAEKWEYSKEDIETGVAEVDDNKPVSNQTIESDNEVIDDYEEGENLVDDFEDLFK